MPKKPPKPTVESVAFGQRLTSLLLDHGQDRHGAGAYLHRRYKVSVPSANAWLNGLNRPKQDLAKRIAEDHGTSFAELYHGTPSEGDKSTKEAIRKLNNDVYAVSIAFGAFASAMRVHRPAEAEDVVRALNKMAPEQYLDRGLLSALLGALGAPRAISEEDDISDHEGN